MNSTENIKLSKFQQLIDYKFKYQKYLREALTTPQLAHELGTNDYNFFETLGDAVIKVIFITQLFKNGTGVRDPGVITKMKQRLENDNTLKKIARNKMQLEKFIFKSEKQDINNTKILADVFEAICGAIYLDSAHNIKIVEEKIINRFYGNYFQIIAKSRIFNKSDLIEFLQKKYRITPRIECEYENRGSDNRAKWVAKDPKIFPEELDIILPKGIMSKECKSIGDAEQDIYKKILDVLKSQ
ncbi:MAG: ribonuclease III domain-containing protein [Promethearchaeota archaeon]